jgi:hypothetical protein
MIAKGLFFLRRPAEVRCTPAGERIGMWLPVVERDPDDHRIVLNQLLVKWKGPEALAFFDEHQPLLRPGRPLLLELDKLRGSDGEWQALATRCELAPPPPNWHADTACAVETSTPQAA